ncbi:zinc ribbon domain-containing protein [Chloroflexota bacterium]
MPIYEFQCEQCSRKTAILVRNFIPPDSIVCSYCGGNELTRVISTFTVIGSKDSISDDMAEPDGWDDLDEEEGFGEEEEY